MCSGLHAKEPNTAQWSEVPSICQIWSLLPGNGDVSKWWNTCIFEWDGKKPKNRKWQNSLEPINQSPFLLTAMLSEDNILLSMLIAN